MQSNQNNRKQFLILLAFTVSIILCFLKFGAYYLTSSNAILSDALESIINVIGSGFAFYSIRLAAQPKDKNHPYGHGKVEFFSAGFEGALIVIASFFITYGAIMRLLNPVPLESLELGSALVIISLICNWVLGKLLVKEGNQLNSMALVADGKHLLSDAWSSVLLVGSLLLIWFTEWFWFDSVASIGFALFLFYSGIKIMRKAVARLMDEMDAGVVNQVVEVINNTRKSYWVDVHNLRVQQYGSDRHIDCHITLPYYWDLIKVHEGIHEFETILKESHDGATEIFVHADPCIPECCANCILMPCMKRSEPFQQLITWEVDNLTQNAKINLQDLP